MPLPGAPSLGSADPVEPVLDLLGVLAYGELSAFERLAADAALAPTLSDRAALDGLAVTEYSHFCRLRDRLTALGADPDAVMGTFADALEEFHDHTAPSDFLEGLVKAVVGDGIAADFYREVARTPAVDPATRQIVLDALAEGDRTAFATTRVRAAVDADPVLAGRLALWARRLVGEALTQAHRVAAEHPGLTTLLGGVGGTAEVSQMFVRIAEAHARRMTALGLES